MKLMLSRKLKYYMRLQYPVCIVVSSDGMVGTIPDFPGCAVLADSVSAVYTRLDDARRAWIRDRVVAGDEIPLPNSHLGPVHLSPAMDSGDRLMHGGDNFGHEAEASQI